MITAAPLAVPVSEASRAPPPPGNGVPVPRGQDHWHWDHDDDWHSGLPSLTRSTMIAESVAL
jgi:hypothetical protein